MLWFIGAIVRGIIWGCIINAVIRGKGYDENWFWWGFFFGWIPLLIACFKPKNTHAFVYKPNSSELGGYKGVYDTDYLNTATSATDWRCSCGRVNANYVGTCACGRVKGETEKRLKEKQREEAVKKQKAAELENKNLELVNLDILAKTKELLDAGIITQAEFEEKKKQLLGVN